MDNPVNWLIAVGIITGASISALCLYVLWVIKTDVRRVCNEASITLDFMRDEVKDIKQRAIPILRSIEETSRNSTSISRRIDNQLEKTESVVDEVQALAGRIVELERYVHSRIIQPLAHVAGVIAGTRKAVQVFSDVLRRSTDRRANGKAEHDE